MSKNLSDLYNNGLNNHSDAQEDVVILESPKVVVETKSSVVPKPSELELIVITCDVSLNMNLNLNLIGRLLPIDDEIIGVKLLNVCSRGKVKNKQARDPQLKEKKKKDGTKKPEPKKRKDFSNQCTIVIKPPNSDNELNLKLFGNGKIVITGGLNKEEGYEAVKILRDKIKPLEDDYQIRHSTQIKNYFDDADKYIKYMNKYYLIFLKIFALYGIDIDLKLDLILNKKRIKKYQMIHNLGHLHEVDLMELDIEHLIKNKLLMSYKDDLDLEKFLKMIQVFDICHHYFTDKNLSAKLDDLEDPIHQLIGKLYNGDLVRLPVTFDVDQFNQPIEVRIQNYNTIFMCNFHIDRKKFTEIMNTNYKHKICSAKFEPTLYQGINTKYISRVCCSDSCVSSGKKKVSLCPCKEISFLIFQEGKIIITGGREWSQILDGYQVITQILRDEYDTVVIEQKIQDNSITNHLPNQINKQHEDGSVTIYLNKLQYVKGNPRNCYLLKKMGLLDKYV